MEDVYECKRGFGQHDWKLIITEYRPRLVYETYSSVVNHRCGRCKRVRATLWAVKRQLKPRYQHNTGLAALETRVDPTVDDWRKHLLAKERELRRAEEERAARREQRRAARQAA